MPVLPSSARCRSPHAHLLFPVHASNRIAVVASKQRCASNFEAAQEFPPCFGVVDFTPHEDIQCRVAADGRTGVSLGFRRAHRRRSVRRLPHRAAAGRGRNGRALARRASTAGETRRSQEPAGRVHRQRRLRQNASAAKPISPPFCGISILLASTTAASATAGSGFRWASSPVPTSHDCWPIIHADSPPPTSPTSARPSPTRWISRTNAACSTAT